MITKQDIRDRADEWQLRMDVVEKDYVLGWLLAASARGLATSTTSSSWSRKRRRTSLSRGFVSSSNGNAP